MNTVKTISSTRPVGGDYFGLSNTNSSELKLDSFVGKFKFKDYHCFKSTNVQRIVEEEEFLEFRHSKYIFFKKDKYNKEHILNWIEWMRGIGGLQFMDKPLPPFSPEKIIIKI